jgi:hypothetical protein
MRSDGQDDTDDVVAARQRDRLRQERRKERERDLRLEKNMSLKRQKLEADRDVSEKMALGVHTGTGGGLAGDVDARLYNQTAGMDSGFGADDEYNTYSKPLSSKDNRRQGPYIVQQGVKLSTMLMNSTTSWWTGPRPSSSLTEVLLVPKEEDLHIVLDRERHPYSSRRKANEGT